MAILSILMFTVSFVGLAQNQERYQGKLGGDPVDIKLSWFEDKTISGYLSFSGKRGSLKIEGDNYVDGVVNVRLYDMGEYFAEGVLEKNITSEKVVWQGYITYSTGRSDWLFFSRYRR